MENEIFGPILPVLSFKSFDEVIKDHVNARGKPLAIYYFGNTSSRNYKRLEEETSSGALSANDIMTQVLSVDLGFGGVGTSGMGRIGGRDGFKQWSNQKAVVQKW